MKTSTHAAMGLAVFELEMLFARDHLPPERYQKIKKAHDRFFLGFIPFLLVMVVINFAAIMGTILAGVPDSVDLCSGFAGADSCKTAHVDYYDNLYYTYDSQTYKYPLIEYGLDPETYEPGDELMVYFDTNRNLIGVSEMTEVSHGMPPFFGVTLGMAMFDIVCCIAYVITANRTFAKDWADFRKQYNRGELKYDE